MISEKQFRKNISVWRIYSLRMLLTSIHRNMKLHPLTHWTWSSNNKTKIMSTFLIKNHMNMYSKYPEHISRLSLRQFRNYSERSISNCANLNQSQIVRQHPDIWERVCIDALSLYQMWQYVSNSRNLSWYSDYWLLPFAISTNIDPAICISKVNIKFIFWVCSLQRWLKCWILNWKYNS